MNCPTCNQLVENGSVFCGNCGQRIAQPQAQPTQSLASPMQQPQPQPFQPGYSEPATVTSPTIVTPSMPLGTNIQPAASPIPQAYPSQTANSQMFTPTNSQSTMQPIMSAAQQYAPNSNYSGAVGATPAYALPQQISHRPGETKAVIGLILGVLSLPGCIIPFLGLVLGITAVVLGSMSIGVKKALGRAAMILGVIGILASIGTFVYNLNNFNSHKSSAVSSGTLQSLDTACYSAKLSDKLVLTHDVSTDCTFTAYTGKNSASASLSINATGRYIDVTDETSFMSYVKATVPNLIISVGKSTGSQYHVTDQKQASFAGKPAYIVSSEDTNGHSAVIAFVYSDTMIKGNNAYVVGIESTSKGASLTDLEKNFIWK